jgi:hypothetical protein
MDGATGSEVHGRGGRAAQSGGVAELDPTHDIYFALTKSDASREAATRRQARYSSRATA